ncbi:MAG: hypothetical protein WKH64_03585 [Chloroflexia bacterium]
MEPSPVVMMGLDPGGRRIGVALSDPTGLLARPTASYDALRKRATC